jgi:hypothetical protein
LTFGIVTAPFCEDEVVIVPSDSEEIEFSTDEDGDFQLSSDTRKCLLVTSLDTIKTKVRLRFGERDNLSIYSSFSRNPDVYSGDEKFQIEQSGLLLVRFELRDSHERRTVRFTFEDPDVARSHDVVSFTGNIEKPIPPMPTPQVVIVFKKGLSPPILYSLIAVTVVFVVSLIVVAIQYDFVKSCLGAHGGPDANQTPMLPSAFVGHKSYGGS